MSCPISVDKTLAHQFSSLQISSFVLHLSSFLNFQETFGKVSVFGHNLVGAKSLAIIVNEAYNSCAFATGFARQSAIRYNSELVLC